MKWPGIVLKLTTYISSPLFFKHFREIKGLVKKYRGGGGGPEHLEMWLIKNTWPTPSLRHKNDWPTPKARLEIKTWTFGFLLIIQKNLVLCLTKFVDTLLQPHQNHRNHTFHWKDECEKPNISCFNGRYESWHKYTAKRGYIEIVCHKAYENFYKDNPFLHITCWKCLD